MYRNIVILCSILIGANAVGELSILRVPSAVRFKGSETLPANLYYDLFAAVLGRYAEHDASWDGAYLKNPFEPATAVVSIIVKGVDSIDIDAKHTYPLVGAPSHFDLEDLTKRIHSSGAGVLTMDMADLTEATRLAQSICNLNIIKPPKPTTSALKPKENPKHKLFLQQIDLIRQFGGCMEFTDVTLPELMTLNIDLSYLSKNSAALSEAKKMLNEAVQVLSKGANRAYLEKALVVCTATKDTAITRFRRQTKQIDMDSLNLSAEYDDSYPVIFNIILWFGVAMLFSLIAICHVIGTMDPGRDSIIYRMTSTRMKKDN